MNDPDTTDQRTEVEALYLTAILNPHNTFGDNPIAQDHRRCGLGRRHGCVRHRHRGHRVRETDVRHYSAYGAEFACNADKAAPGSVPNAVVLCDRLNNSPNHSPRRRSLRYELFGFR